MAVEDFRKCPQCDVYTPLGFSRCMQCNREMEGLPVDRLSTSAKDSRSPLASLGALGGAIVFGLFILGLFKWMFR